MHRVTLLGLTLLLAGSGASDNNTSIAENGLRFLRKVHGQCEAKEDLFKCYKIQALKVVDRALHSKTLNIVDGLTLVSESRQGRMLEKSPQLNETKLEHLESQQIDGLLMDTTARFMDTHKVQIDMGKMVEEGRRKKKHHGHHALLWALAIKGSFLAMAYKGIAVMAGTALIVGKMALLLSAILGLKKLVSGAHHEKTTFEIVKHPKYSESHGTSYEDEGHYRRVMGPVEEYGRKIQKRHIVPPYFINNY